MTKKAAKIFAWKNRIIWEIGKFSMETPEYFGNLPGKIGNFLPGSTTPDFKPD